MTSVEKKGSGAGEKIYSINPEKMELSGGGDSGREDLEFGIFDKGLENTQSPKGSKRIQLGKGSVLVSFSTV